MQFENLFKAWNKLKLAKLTSALEQLKGWPADDHVNKQQTAVIC